MDGDTNDDRVERESVEARLHELWPDAELGERREDGLYETSMSGIAVRSLSPDEVIAFMAQFPEVDEED